MPKPNITDLLPDTPENRLNPDLFRVIGGFKRLADMTVDEVIDSAEHELQERQFLRRRLTDIDAIPPEEAKQWAERAEVALARWPVIRAAFLQCLDRYDES